MQNLSEAFSRIQWYLSQNNINLSDFINNNFNNGILIRNTLFVFKNDLGQPTVFYIPYNCTNSSCSIAMTNSDAFNMVTADLSSSLRSNKNVPPNLIAIFNSLIDQINAYLDYQNFPELDKFVPDNGIDSDILKSEISNINFSLPTVIAKCSAPKNQDKIK